MTVFDNDNAARFQSACDVRCDGLCRFIGQYNEVPFVLAEIEFLKRTDFRPNAEAQSSGLGFGLAYAFVRRIESGHVPALLREEDRITSLSQADVQRRSGPSVPHHLDEKCI